MNEPQAPRARNRDTHIASGPHRGKRWSEAPAEALTAMVQVGHPDAGRAARELARRARDRNAIAFTRHAVDAGSLLVGRAWVEQHVPVAGDALAIDQHVGILSYLDQRATLALFHGDTDLLGRYVHDGLAFEVTVRQNVHTVEDVALHTTEENDDA